jgi:hypothetical protein
VAQRVSQGGVTVPSEVNAPVIEVSQGGITISGELSGIEILLSQGGITVASYPVPNAPINVLAEAQSPTSIQVTWENDGFEQDGIEVDRKKGAGAWGKIADKPGNATGHLDEGLEPKTNYGYRVRAEKSDHFGDYSASTADSEDTTPALKKGIIKLMRKLHRV